MSVMLGKQLSRIPTQSPQMETISYGGDNGRLVTVMDEKLLGPDDFKVLTNVRYENGKRRTREGLYQLTADASGLSGGKYFQTIEVVPIAGTQTILGVSDDFKLYKITGAEGSMAVNAAVTTLGNVTTILSFAGYAVLCDRGYIKYYDGTNLNIFYDNGTGTSGYMFNHLTDDNDASIPLYTGSTLAVGNLETTVDWGSIGTIPTLKVRVWLSKTGSPTGTMVAKSWNNAGAVQKTSTYILDVSTLSTNAAVYDFEFSTTTEDLLANTARIYGVHFTSSSSDAANYVSVNYDTVASGGYGYTYTTIGGWVADATKNFLIGLKPGLPPKASFGCVADNRLHIRNHVYPGRLFICAPGDGFDWSTPTLAGYVTAINDNYNSYKIGAVIAKYGDVWIFGNKSQPYLAKLTGSSPADWNIALTGQEVYTAQKSIQDTIDDLYFSSVLNCHSMAGVEQYGDIRVNGPGNPIKNLFETYWTSSSFSGYWGKTGQYFIYLPTYGTMVCHTKDPMKRWSRYTYKNLTESAYCGVDDLFYVACTNGHLYRLKEGQLTDDATAYDITQESGIIEFPYGEMQLVRIYQMMPTSGATTAVLHVYPNGSGTAKRDLSIAAGAVPQEATCTMNARSLKIKVDTVAFNATTFFGPVIIRARKLYGLGQR